MTGGYLEYLGFLVFLVDVVLATLWSPSGPVGGPDPQGLTGREREVLERIALARATRR